MNDPKRMTGPELRKHQEAQEQKAREDAIQKEKEAQEQRLQERRKVASGQIAQIEQTWYSLVLAAAKHPGVRGISLLATDQPNLVNPLLLKLEAALKEHQYSVGWMEIDHEKLAATMRGATRVADQEVEVRIDRHQMRNILVPKSLTLINMDGFRQNTHLVVTW